MNDHSEDTNVGARLIWFGLAMLAAMVAAGLLVFPAPPIIGAAPFFPAGLFFSRRGLTPLVVGWGIYLGLLVLLLKARTSRQVSMVFLILLVLLGVNVGGCKHVADNTRLPHTI